MSTKYSQPVYSHHQPKRQSSVAPKLDSQNVPSYQHSLNQPINLMQLMSNMMVQQQEGTSSYDEGQQQYTDNSEQQSHGERTTNNYDPSRYQQEQANTTGGNGMTYNMGGESSGSKEKGTAGSHGKSHNYQQSHSLGRDLQGMGLITQVKKGDKLPSSVYLSKKQQYNGPTTSTPVILQEETDQGALLSEPPLLKPQRPEMRGRKTLVLDLDETLVHSSFKPPTGREPPADIVLPVDIEGRICNVYVLVRPGCLRFLSEMSKYYEIVIFTASLQKYADPLMDIIDQRRVAPQRLFREHCTFHEQSGVFVKDMARVGRSLSDVFIIDNSPLSYGFQPENGMPILSWYDDRTDTKLIELIPVLKLLSEIPDVRPVLKACCTRDNIYLTDKSILMCTRILEELQYKRRHMQLVSQPSEQGRELQQNAPSTPVSHLPPQQHHTSQVLHAKILEDSASQNNNTSSSGMKPQTPLTNVKVNNWILVPPSNIDLTPKKITPLIQTSVPKVKRNHNPDSMLPQSSASSPSTVKHQIYSLTQTPSKKTLCDQRQNELVPSTVQKGSATPQKIQKSTTAIRNDCFNNKSELDNQSSKVDDNSSTVSKSIGKKRPKTASRDHSALGLKNGGTTSTSQSNRYKIESGRSPMRSSNNNFNKTVASILQAQQAGIPASGQSSSKAAVRSSYHTQKSIEIKSQKIKSPSVRPATRQSSTRNSSERMTHTAAVSILNQSNNSTLIPGHSKVFSTIIPSSAIKTRPNSSKKKPTTFSEKDLMLISGAGVSSQTPLATKGLTKLGMTMQSASKGTVRAPSQGSYQKQGVQIITETPPTRLSGGSLLSRLIQSGVHTPSTAMSSNNTVTSTSQKKGQSGKHITGKRQSTSPHEKIRENSLTTQGIKSPGKIFSTPQSATGQSTSTVFTQQQQQSNTYQALMKNLSPQFTNMMTPSSKIINTTPKNQIADIQTSAANNIKGQKLQSGPTNLVGANAYLSQKFNQTLNLGKAYGGQPSQHYSQLPDSSIINAYSYPQRQPYNISDATPSFNNSSCDIHLMLNEFERTKNLNKELLLMRNIGSPKQPNVINTNQKQ